MDEGYIKFNLVWKKDKPVNRHKIQQINDWRSRLFELGLIGVYQNGIGFGNISIRSGDNDFLITGSATGGIKQLNENHYAVVNEYDLRKNNLVCTGPVKASSESLTHAVIYECSPQSNAVIHIHNLTMWKQLLFVKPTTSVSVPYGTPEMAEEIKRLFEDGSLSREKVIVMGGHEEGIIAFGETVNEAGELLLRLQKQINSL